MVPGSCARARSPSGAGAGTRRLISVRLAGVTLALFAGGGALAPTATAQGDLQRHRPLLRYDSRERHFALSVESAVRGRVGERLLLDPQARGPSVVYGRTARDSDGRRWLQYWLFFADNPQDRGVVRTGRHEGDWELFQLRLAEQGRPIEASFAQHTWAEGCGWGKLERAGDAPVLFVANASHALYPRAGEADRPFPDPDDEADGRGRTVRPRLVVVSERRPAWMRRRGRFGSSDGGPIPGEHPSPRGPAFQSERWDDPGAFHDREARPCGAGPPGRPWQTALLIAAAALTSLALLWRRQRARSAST